MDKSEIVDKALDNLGISKAVHEVYRDALQPATREVGKNLLTVAKAVSLAMTPLSASVWGFERMRDWLGVRLTRKLASLPPDQIRTPPLHIAGPALVNLQFSQEVDELREMYASLLAASMTIGRNAHPSFVQVIQQLSPDEAKILSRIAENDGQRPITSESERASSMMYLGGGIEDKFKRIAIAADVDNPDLCDSYLDNLVRLRLLQIYESTESHFDPGSVVTETEPRLDVEQTRQLDITEYGAWFIECCVTNKDVGQS